MIKSFIVTFLILSSIRVLGQSTVELGVVNDSIEFFKFVSSEACHDNIETLKSIVHLKSKLSKNYDLTIVLVSEGCVLGHEEQVFHVIGIDEKKYRNEYLYSYTNKFPEFEKGKLLKSDAKTFLDLDLEVNRLSFFSQISKLKEKSASKSMFLVYRKQSISYGTYSNGRLKVGDVSNLPDEAIGEMIDHIHVII